MTGVELIAKYEHKIRPAILKLPPGFASWIFSAGRKSFLALLSNDKPVEQTNISHIHRKTLWGLSFNNSLFNAAGMFKNGNGYYIAAKQKAGAFLAGTTTAIARTGNKKNNIKHPVLPLSKSGIALNWMGLPNDGHEIVAFRLSKIEKQIGCPLGISISSDPHLHRLDSLNGILTGFRAYESAGVDFFELNESCPNVEHDTSAEKINGLDKNLVERLEFISQQFLKKRKRNLPVIVKFSVDTNPALVPELLGTLLALGFDGVNFGNTSTEYEYYISDIDKSELANFKYFTENFGGGVSGRLLKAKSFGLSSLAVQMIKSKVPAHEFHVIRTGGIENNNDIELSEKAGISLNQWFTGYFDYFALYGHKLYEKIFNIDI